LFDRWFRPFVEDEREDGGGVDDDKAYLTHLAVPGQRKSGGGRRARERRSAMFVRAMRGPLSFIAGMPQIAALGGFRVEAAWMQAAGACTSASDISMTMRPGASTCETFRPGPNSLLRKHREA
jgi:hypothetical protein